MLMVGVVFEIRALVVVPPYEACRLGRMGRHRALGKLKFWTRNWEKANFARMTRWLQWEHNLRPLKTPRGLLKVGS